MAGKVVEVALPNGAVALVQVPDADHGAGAQKVAAWPSRFDFAEVGTVLEGVATAVRTALHHAAPSRTTVELGLQLVVKSGKLTGLIVEGEGTASLKVTLEWQGEQPQPAG